MARGMKAGIIGGIGAVLVIALVQIGVVGFSWPDLFSPAELLRKVTTTDGELELKAPASIVRIEPVSLDCRARILAHVPVEGTREVKVAGVVVRTDTVSVDAQGDVDTCVSADAVSIDKRDDGSFVVDVPGEAIEFVRPRVDMVASAQRSEYDKGWLGELTDLLPGVSDGDSMIPGAYAFAQQVIGGNACMSAAFDVTSQVLTQAYTDQLTAQGASPDSVTVEIGEPDFDQHRLPDETGDVDFSIRGSEVRCTLAADANEGVSPDWEDLAP